jgi:hypothetical protein
MSIGHSHFRRVPGEELVGALARLAARFLLVRSGGNGVASREAADIGVVRPARRPLWFAGCTGSAVASFTRGSAVPLQAADRVCTGDMGPPVASLGWQQQRRLITCRHAPNPIGRRAASSSWCCPRSEHLSGVRSVAASGRLTSQRDIRPDREVARCRLSTLGRSGCEVG